MGFSQGKYLPFFRQGWKIIHQYQKPVATKDENITINQELTFIVLKLAFVTTVAFQLVRYMKHNPWQTHPGK